RCDECRARGGSGIPRAELLGYLRTAAEALDALGQQTQLAHLGLNPRNLLLSQGRLRLADFGLIPLVCLPTGRPAAQLNASYAAPELAEAKLSLSADQYSLALIYVELL